MRNHPGQARNENGIFLGGMPAQSPIERFYEKVRVTPEDPDACWNWGGAIGKHGYGNFWNGERTVRAHVFSWEQAYGPVPRGKILDHRCRNTRCVRPTHLRTVTHQENALLSPTGFAAEHAAKIHCPSGHPYDVPNTYVDVKGRRYCRICRANRERDRRRRNH